MEMSLLRELPQLAVALDTIRAAVESVLADEHPRSTQIAMARTRAELALEIWRETMDARP
jgi:hypothetical protein